MGGSRQNGNRRAGQTADDFRHMALGMKDATEGTHIGHPDFRGDGRIFATLHADNRQHGIVKITPEQQQRFVQGRSGVFTPERGAWGRHGCTRVRLDAVGEETLGEALTLAWQDCAQWSAPRRSKPAAVWRASTAEQTTTGSRHGS